mmetsp:Transcript_17185/g.53284  ORF Transcript_17185/g.53284 Transcript_17185/m.53284 type:complete len:379 (+) Transcript_17185:225-1361(+)
MGAHGRDGGEGGDEREAGSIALCGIACVRAPSRSRTAFLALACGAVGFVAIFMLLQEQAITSAKQAGCALSAAWVTLINEAVYALCAYAEHVRLRSRSEARRGGWALGVLRWPPWRTAYAAISLAVFGGVWTTNASLRHVDFATRIVAKSAKVLPVMGLSWLLMKKKYSLMEAAAALGLALGVALFSVGDALHNPAWQPLGSALLALALTCDAAAVVMTERFVFKSRAAASSTAPPRHCEVIFYTSSLAAVMGLMTLAVGGNLREEVQRGLTLGRLWTQELASASVCGFLGLSCVMQLVNHFGATEAEIIKAARKAVSVGISYARFGKRITLPCVGGLGLVLFSLWLTHQARARRAQQAAAARQPKLECSEPLVVALV